jgi:hypothetical protein
MNQLSEASERFLQYVRTKQIFTLRFDKEKSQYQTPNENDLPPVHIPRKFIESEFFPRDATQQLQQLINGGFLLRLEGEAKPGKRPPHLYQTLKPGKFDLTLMKGNKPTNDLHKQMLRNLMATTIQQGTSTGIYFELFQKYRYELPELFFKVDAFSGRIHTPITNLKGSFREKLMVYNSPVQSIDVSTMQPLLLGKVLRTQIGTNDFSNWIDEGRDVYLFLKDLAGLNCRDEAKKLFYQIMFGKPNKALEEVFGASNWIQWVNGYKGEAIPEHPHNRDGKGRYKRHNNLAWLLQSEEVRIMTEIWKRLVSSNIPFLTVHDEVLIPVHSFEQAETLMHEVLKNEFTFYRLNYKASPLREAQNDNSKSDKSDESDGLKNIFFSPPQFISIEQPRKPRSDEKQIDLEGNRQKLAELEAYFEGRPLPETPFKYSDHNTITDCEKFVKYYLGTCNDHLHTANFLFYYNKLLKLRTIIESKTIKTIEA